jgi:hypothetical protein
MFQIEVRPATAEDIVTIKGQLSECIAIHVEVLGGEHGALDRLAKLLDTRSHHLQGALEKAVAGESLIFHDGKIAFHHEQLMQMYQGTDVEHLSLASSVDPLRHP